MLDKFLFGEAQLKEATTVADESNGNGEDSWVTDRLRQIANSQSINPSAENRGQVSERE